MMLPHCMKLPHCALCYHTERTLLSTKPLQSQANTSNSNPSYQQWLDSNVLQGSCGGSNSGPCPCHHCVQVICIFACDSCAPRSGLVHNFSQANSCRAARQACRSLASPCIWQVWLGQISSCHQCTSPGKQGLHLVTTRQARNCCCCCGEIRRCGRLLLLLLLLFTLHSSSHAPTHAASGTCLCPVHSLLRQDSSMLLTEPCLTSITREVELQLMAACQESDAQVLIQLCTNIFLQGSRGLPAAKQHRPLAQETDCSKTDCKRTGRSLLLNVDAS